MSNKSILERTRKRVCRNNYGIRGAKAVPGVVNLEYSHTLNIGDSISPVVVEWMLAQKGWNLSKKTQTTKHLFATGSVLGKYTKCDATVWGSGILNEDSFNMLKKQSKYKKLDIRAVRGPKTRQLLLDAGYSCPPIYGDPAILMPFIYSPPKKKEQKYDVALVLHHRTTVSREVDEEHFLFNIPNNVHLIDTKTDNYIEFINQLNNARTVISTSLHGIILAESYGIPSVFLNWGVSDQLFKYEDWYLSTDRCISSCRSLEEAMEMEPMELPELDTLRNALIDSFPYDIWEK